MRTSSLWLGPLLLLAFGPGCAALEAEQRPGPQIDELRIEGTHAVSAGELREKILTSDPGWVPPTVPLLGKAQFFDPNAWQGDLRRIERYYQAEGYYQAKVLEEQILIPPAHKDHVVLRVKVFEGEPTRVLPFFVTGLQSLPPALVEELVKRLPLEPGDILKEARWETMKALLERRLREAGYAEAKLEGEIHVETDTHLATIQLEATPGQHFRFGRVAVANPDGKVTARQIIDQVEEAITPGSDYSESALEEAKARVQKMGVFGAVKLNRGAVDRADGTVPIIVEVREAPFRSERAGFGLGIDLNRQDVHLLGDYTNRNFFGDLRRYTLRGKLGYAVLPSLFAKDPKTGVVGLISNELEQPHVLHPTLSLQASLVLQRGLEPAYDYIGGTPRLGIIWRPRSTLTIFPSINLDVFQLSNPTPLNGNSPEATYGCPLTCVLAYLEQTIELDRRDDRNEPRNGFYLALSLQEGWVPPRAERAAPFTYLRIQPDARAYVSFGSEQRLTLAGKVKVGTLLSGAPGSGAGGQTPILARFFSGGGSSMRGFGTRRLSALQAVADRPDPLFNGKAGLVPGVTQPIGGDGLFESSAELRYNLVGALVLALFLDAGFVTYERFDWRQVPAQLEYAAGFGLRYRTPFGPIRLDLARRLPFGPPLRVIQPEGLNVLYPDDGSCFGLGHTSGSYAGKPEGVCAFHLSIGEAF